MQFFQLTIACLLLSPALPQDLPTGEEPREEVGVLVHAEGIQDGYTLIAPLRSRETFLIDSQGRMVHAWGSELAPSGPVYLRENGNLVRPGRHEDNKRFRGGGIGGRLQEFDWDGVMLWDYLMVDDGSTQHHDLALMPNGNIMTINWTHKTAEEAIAAGRDPEVVLEKGLWSLSLLEIRPEYPDGGEVAWEWHAWDHLIQDFDDSLASFGSIPDHPERIDINGDFRDRLPMTEAERKKMEEIERQMAALGYAGGADDDEDEDEEPSQRFERGKQSDWLHTNSVCHHEELDLLVLSTPHMNEVWVIDRSTSKAEAKGGRGGRWGKGGDLLYRWGNPRNYGAGTDADRALWYQHDPTWIDTEGGGLNILMYNNGRGRPEGDFSTVIELVLPFDRKTGFEREPGKPFGPLEPAWSWGAEGLLFSPFISGSQRLSNGNTLICEGAPGRLIEVTSAGEVVWEFKNDVIGELAPTSDIAPPVQGGAMFRATRIEANHPAIEGRELEPF